MCLRVRVRVHVRVRLIDAEGRRPREGDALRADRHGLQLVRLLPLAVRAVPHLRARAHAAPAPAAHPTTAARGAQTYHDARMHSSTSVVVRLRMHSSRRTSVV
eukprot:6199340-Pleurochrysis_carterae.AAC.3